MLGDAPRQQLAQRRQSRAGCRSRRARHRRLARDRPQRAAQRRPPASTTAGSQPQPGFSTSSPASSDCRETQNGSTARSSRGPISASASGGGMPPTLEAGAAPRDGSRLRRPAAHRLRPRWTSTPAWYRRRRGSTAAGRPASALRLAIRWRDRRPSRARRACPRLPSFSL